jgi:hypothetical protein
MENERLENSDVIDNKAKDESTKDELLKTLDQEKE